MIQPVKFPALWPVTVAVSWLLVSAAAASMGVS